MGAIMIFSKSAVAGALGLTLLAGGAEASFTIDISQTGGNVVAARATAPWI